MEVDVDFPQALKPTALRNLIIASALLVGCGDDSPSAPDADRPDVRRPPVTQPWEVETLVGDDIGVHLHMVVSAEGEPALAYFPTYSRRFGLCGEIGGMDIPEKTFWDLSYRTRSGGTWSDPEIVTSVLHATPPPGLDLRVSPEGVPVIATVTGEPWVRLRYCMANDVGLFLRGEEGWVEEVAVRTSGEAMTGMEASDYGEVIGHWPGLAISSDDTYLVAYKDVHAGGIQQDDFKRADLEAALGSPSSWNAYPVDVGQGAGDFNRAAIDPDGNPYIIYFNPQEFVDESSRGIFVARSLDSGMTWQRVRLANISTLDGPDIHIDADGIVRTAFYNADEGHLMVATLRDPMLFESLTDGWSVEVIGDGAYDEGQNPNIVVSATGTVAVSYYRCGLATRSSATCEARDDAVIFGYQEGTAWNLEIIEEGEPSAACGTYPTLQFGPDGNAWVAYQCQTLREGSLVDRVHFATRRPL